MLYAEKLAREEGLPGFEESSDGESEEDDTNNYKSRSKRKTSSNLQHEQQIYMNNGSGNHYQEMSGSVPMDTTNGQSFINNPKSQMQVLPDPVVNNNNNQPTEELIIDFKWNLGFRAFNTWLCNKLEKIKQHEFDGSLSASRVPNDILRLKTEELNSLLADFINEVRKPTGEVYAPESIYYLCLGIQYYMSEIKKRNENLFLDSGYAEFQEAFDKIAIKYNIRIDAEGHIISKIEEEILWATNQLGVHSPAVLLNTILYFNTKYFFLDKVEAHKKLSFTNVKRHSKRNIGPNGEEYGRSSFLRYYPDFHGLEQVIYEQGENYDNPLRCPVELYNFYLSKW